MYIYDFDKTIYAGDSSIDFWVFCLKRHPKILLRIPGILFSAGLFLFGIKTKKQFKESFFGFLSGVDGEAEAILFWEVFERKLRHQFISQLDDNAVIISASPEFLLRPLVDKLGVSLLASKVDVSNGSFLSENCYGEEKVKRFLAEYPDTGIEKFYSDSLSDSPLADRASQAFIVSGEKIIAWGAYTSGPLKKVKQIFLSKDFLLFVFCGGMGTIVYYVISLVLSDYISPVIAFIFGYGISLFVTYGLATALVFHEKMDISRFGKFVLSYVPNFLIQFLFVSIFLTIFLWAKAVVYALSVIVALPLTFLLVKFFVFGKSLAKKW